MLVTDTSAQLRILWIAYVFPPAGGTQGVRMKRYLEEIIRAQPGAQIDVLTICQSRANPQYDTELERDLPHRAHIYRVRPGMLHNARYGWALDRRNQVSRSRLSRSILTVSIKLSNIGWIPRAAWWLVRRSRSTYDAIYVFVDPFGSLVLGLLAHRLNPRARLVLEYGDPRTPTRKVSPILSGAAARVEAMALSRSSGIIFRTPAAVRAYRDRYRGLELDRFCVLYGGVDWEAYDEIAVDAAEQFTICYTGTIYADSVDPAPFFQAVARVVARHEGSLRVLMMGAESPQVIRLVRQLGLQETVSLEGHVPIGQIAVRQRTAHLLLAFGVNCEYKISSKLAQYVAARVPVLYVSEAPDDQGAELIRRSRRGLCVANDVDAIEAALLDAWSAWQGGRLAGRFDLSRTGEYSWEQVAGGVMALLGGTRAALS